MRKITLCIPLLLANWAFGQLDFMPSEPLPAAEARVVEVTSNIERELAQLQALADAKAWDEAVDGMLRLAAESNNALVEVSDDCFLPIGNACQWHLSRWPAEGLERYRQRVDATARQMLETALAARDTAGIQQVIDQYFVSSVGDDALLAMADLSLEAGNLSKARSSLQMLSPRLSSDDGRLWGVILTNGTWTAAQLKQLATSDLAKRAATASLVYPDTDLPVADMLARLAVISIRQRNFARAEQELALLEAWYPNAQGVLAGRQAVLAESVASSLQSAKNWPMPAAQQTSPAVGDLNQVVWRHEAPTPAVRTAQRPVDLWLRQVGTPAEAPLPAIPDYLLPFTGNEMVIYTPVDAELLQFSAGDPWIALNAATGKPLFGETGTVYGPPVARPQASRQNNADNSLAAPQIAIRARQLQMQVEVRNGMVIQRELVLNNRPMAAGQSSNPPQGCLIDDLLYAVTLPKANATIRSSAAPATKHLMVLDLSAEGKLELEIEPDEGTQFVTAPLVTDDYIYLVEQHTEQGGQVSVACFARTTGRNVWRTPVCAISGEGASLSSDALTQVEDKLVLAAPGLVVTVDAITGRMKWARKYERARSTAPDDLALVGTRTRGAVLATSEGIVCAPVDAAGMFALDSETGQTLWYNAQPWDVEYVLGVVENRLIAAGNQLWILDATTGQRLSQWPHPMDGNLVLRGRACMAGDEVFCPTKDAIHTFNVRTSQPSRVPIPLETDEGANLTVCGQGLLVTTDEFILFLGKSPPKKGEQKVDEIRLGTLQSERREFILD
ncbi:outer membrane protein assembly factor BamB family protein [Aeoliella mucimassa]|uniref:PQQ enzyme repeat protein n=1 Tax=Aeoliella mucimassa TaxID=2527972 RepID=A0A518AKL2_9BACT|nr:PQQ-binding-like beta-propeller repeat protein [Aeoliella mucimassa]QDU55261.1 PQQ enzyme repeat protein [Aeoliella mucimassa]